MPRHPRHQRRVLRTPSSSSVSRNSRQTKREIAFKGKNEYVNIDIDDLRKNLQELRKVADVHIEDLDTKYKALFDNVVEVFIMAYGSSAYEHLYNCMLDVFSGLDVKKRTVGSYFLGCSIENKKGKLACSEYCASALPPPTGRKWKLCEDYVCNYDGQLHILNRPEGSHVALVYVDDNVKFVGLTATEVELCRRIGIRQLKLIASSTEQEMVSFQRLEDVPVVEDNGNRNGNGNNNGNNNGNGDVNGTWWIWLIILAVIVVVIIVLVGYAWGGLSKWNHYDDKSKGSMKKYSKSKANRPSSYDFSPRSPRSSRVSRSPRSPRSSLLFPWE